MAPDPRVSLRLSIEGMPELERALEGIPLHIRQEIERPALEEAGRIILGYIQSRITPYSKTGKTAAEIGMVTTTVAGKTSVVIRPAYKRVGTTHILEWGSKERRQGSGTHPGTKATNFFNNGVDDGLEGATNLIRERILSAAGAYWAALDGGA